MAYGLMKKVSRKFSTIGIKNMGVEFMGRAGVRAKET